MFWKKKEFDYPEKHLTDDEKLYYQERYGTYNFDIVRNIKKFLMKEKNNIRIQYIQENLESVNSVNAKGWNNLFINNNYIKHIARESLVLKKVNTGSDITPTEKTVFNIDKIILIKSFEAKGFSKTDSQGIVEKIYKVSDIKEIKSLCADDYKVDEYYNVNENHKRNIKK